MLGIIVVILVFSLGSWGVNADAVIQGYDQTRRYAQDAKLLTSAVTEYKEIAQAEIDYQNKIEEQGYEFEFPLEVAGNTLKFSCDFASYSSSVTDYYASWADCHGGVDCLGSVSPDDDKVVAAASGTVTYVEGDTYNTVKIQDKRGYVWRYLHMDEVYVTNGQEVEAGTVLGSVGGMGPEGPDHYGNHLHIAVVKAGGKFPSGQINAFSVGKFNTEGKDIVFYNYGSNDATYSTSTIQGITSESNIMPLYMYAPNFVKANKFEYRAGSSDGTVLLTYSDDGYASTLTNDSKWWGRYLDEKGNVVAGPFIPSKETE